MKQQHVFFALFMALMVVLTVSCQKEPEFEYAELISGPAFNDAIPKDDKTKSVVFEYNSRVKSGTLLSTPDSPVPIYGNLDGTTWRVSTRASQIYAHPNCSYMFKSSYDFYTTHSGRHRRVDLLLEKIDFGDGFNTSNVTDMMGMFLSGQELQNLDISNFNTSNVTNMSKMFFCCWSLTSLEVSKFNTEKVTDMSKMFFNCTNMTNLNLSHFDMSGVSNKEVMCYALSTKSGACTITCPLAVQTELESGTDLPTSGVTFTWVRPSSSK